MLALILAVVLVQAATAPTGPAPSPAAAKPLVMTMPDWIRKPNGEDVARYYPQGAQMKGLAGRATIECQVIAAGALASCRVIEESPADEGFGEAALRLGTLFRMRPLTKDGTPVDGGVIRIPIRFVLPGEAISDPLSTQLSCYGQAAALADKQPDSAQAWTAVTYFSAQVAVLAANSKSSPTVYEDELRQAHLGAVRTKNGPDNPTLRTCIDFANSHMKSVIKPK
jgi:TonB family protein